MTARATDRLLGLILIIVSALWCWGVVETIPGIDDGSRLGARGFPLGLGVLLGGLGLIVLLRTFLGTAPEPEAEGPGIPRPTELWAILVTVGFLVGYAALLKYAGFLVATFVITALAVGPALRVWRPRLIAGMALGLSLGIYLVFGKLLGVYLPHGSLVDLSF